ncbi:hypothetical protein M0R19_08635 [Candidatus Pacearchaeota archaeon]|nr:hypothetical protein [Candidatus Pacearchaeota archaeon]
MKNKEEILEELHKQFDKAQKELGFKSSFDELEEIFFIEDMALKQWYVSNQFSRQLCGRIVEMYNSWLVYLHALIMPPQGNIICMMESRVLNDNEKKEINEIIKKIVAITSTNTLLALAKNKKDEGKFVDDSVNTWNKELKPKITLIVEKINSEWKK